MALFWALPIQGFPATLKLAGHVYELAGEPVVGATVALVVGDSTISGVACGIDGAFKLKLSSDEPHLLNRAKLEFSAIGFRPISRPLAKLANLNDITITLAPVLVQFAPVVSRTTLAAVDAEVVDGDDITQAARRSILSSNPIEAIRDASVTRSGSTLGSRVRFSGSAPQYTLNGQSLGTDPAHYGMFSVLPGSAVSELEYTDHTAHAGAESPTAVRMRSDRSFIEDRGGNMTLSALEATGSFHYGSDDYFLRGAARESLLDKLVERIDVERARQSIPPTDFQDVFLSGGLRASTATRLFVDQYVARDELVYNTQGTALNSAGIDTRQKTKTTMTHLQAQRISANTLWNAHVGIRTSLARYSAISAGSDDPASLALNLHESGYTVDLSIDGALERGGANWKFGASGRMRNYAEVTLTQRNWNFLPPEATSDAPHYFQSSLNELYGDVTVPLKTSEETIWGEVEDHVGPWKLSAGLRAQKYDYLASDAELLWRASAQRMLADNASIVFSGGTYAESPIGNILDPYQILVRENLSNLKSVKTALLKSQLAFNAGENARIGFSVFAKDVADLPALTPSSFPDRIADNDSQVLYGLDMTSNERRRMYGIALSLEDKHFLAGLFNDRLSLNLSYAYTHTAARRNDVSVFVAEEAPHKVDVDAFTNMGKGWNFGARMTARTGYRYTEFSMPAIPFMGLPVVYRSRDYLAWERSQNSQRFPAHVNVNLSLSHRAGAVTTYFNVGNALDRANPLVSLSDGFVYDAGILPSAGVSYSF